MYIAPADASLGEDEWRPFVEATGFGHLVAVGRDRDVPIVVPTQFLLEEDTVLLHLVRSNPIFGALAENPRVLLSVAGDWAFIPSAWKAIGDEDPELGIPTTYYAAVQLTGTATVHDERHQPAAWPRSCAGSCTPSSPTSPWRTPLWRTRGDRVDPRHPIAVDSVRRSSSTAATSTRPPARRRRSPAGPSGPRRRRRGGPRRATAGPPHASNSRPD